MFTQRSAHLLLATVLTGLLSGAAHADQPQVFSGVGLTDATNALNAFRAAIGGNNNGANPPPVVGGRREINWDGVKLDGTDFNGNSLVIDLNHTVGIPVNRFQARGVIFQEVYAVSGDGFASVNPDTAGHFPAFSPNNTFAMFNDNTIELNFVLASDPTTVPLQAGTRGFGAIFLDVNTPNTSKIKFLHGGTELGEFPVPASSTQGDVEFLGVLFDNPTVTRVELTLGNAILFDFDGHTITPGGAEQLPYTDFAVVDDFVYAEPIIQPQSLSLKPGTVPGGENVIGKVTLNVPAPSGGASVTLSTTNPDVHLPSSVLVPAGKTSASFTIHTDAVNTSSEGAITVSLGGVSLSKELKIRPIGVASVTLSPDSIKGGNSVTGTVTLELPAAPGNIIVDLSSSNPSLAAVSPASITIPAGSLTGTFKINTHAVSTSANVTIKAKANGVSKSKILTITP